MKMELCRAVSGCKSERKMALPWDRKELAYSYSATAATAVSTEGLWLCSLRL
jgi:hypothetical protein